ncbi:MAG: hypothetical protein ACJ72D_08390, partial [Marmoricola sp.]
MSRLIDPSICPDCRANLDAAATCTGCGLQLTGPVAADLWSTMQSADSLVERLRSPAGARVDSAVLVGAPTARTAGLPLAPPTPVPPPRPARRLNAGSVPAVLFGVGALCLLVAAVVFVAVAWSSLGLGARTTILLAVTGTFAAMATRLTLRGLRGAAETFWLVVGALVSIDLVAGYAAGLLDFDTLPGRHAVAVLGAALLALGLGVGAWARQTPLPRLVTPTLLSAVGTLLLVACEGWAAPHTALATTVAVLGLVALAAYTERLGLRPTTYAVSGLAVTSWGVLVVAGLDRAAQVSISTWWTDGAGWPLLAAVVLAGAAALAGRLTEQLRAVAAAAAELAIILLVVGPGGTADTVLVLLCGLAVAMAGASLVLPRTWAIPAAAFGGLGGVVAAGYLLLRPVGVLVGLPTTAPARSANLGMHLPPPDAATAAWTPLVLALVVVLVGLALIRWISDPAAQQPALRGWVVGAPTVAALGVAAAFLETTPTLLAGVLAWTAVLLVLAALAACIRQAPAPAVLITVGYLGVVGLRLAVASHLLVALLATGLAIGLALGYRRTGADPVTRAITGAAALVAGGFAATHFPYLCGGAGDAAGLALAVLAAAGGLLAAHVARGSDRPVLEVTALALGLGAVAFPVEDAVTTLVLTLVGSAVALVAVLHRD